MRHHLGPVELDRVLELLVGHLDMCQLGRKDGLPIGRRVKIPRGELNLQLGIEAEIDELIGRLLVRRPLQDDEARSEGKRSRDGFELGLHPVLLHLEGDAIPKGIEDDLA